MSDHEDDTDNEDGTSSASGAPFKNVFMVQSHLAPPKQFSFKSEDWIRWRTRWCRYAIGSGLSAQGDEFMINTFIYTMGEKAEDILLSFKLTEEGAASYKTVLEEFDKHFGARKNVVLERHRFLRRRQQPNESVDDFVADLHRLAESANLGDLKDDLIRDVLILGIKDRKLSDALTLDGSLTLERATTRVRQKEELQRQQQAEAREQGSSGGGRASDNNNKPKQRTPPAKECSKCGRSPQHAFSECPAKGSECSKCHGKNHWARKCPGKGKVNRVEQEDDSEDDDLFVGRVSLLDDASVNRICAVDNSSQRRPPWNVEVSVNKIPAKFQVDTGADVTVISEETYRAQFAAIPLRDTRHRLRGPSRRFLTVLGVLETSIGWRDRAAEQAVYVIKEKTSSLLGRPAIEDLHLLRWDLDDAVAAAIEQLDAAKKAVARETAAREAEFPEVFRGLGCINYSRPYCIVLKEGAVPHAVTAPRRVSVKLREKVREELQRMVKMGVISPVDEATEWCAPMVVALKANGGVRICVDYTELNKNVRRERYLMPSVDETLALLGDAKWFSKLDANHGYYQLAMEDASKKLTTFITPFGRFCYNRLPMGLTSAGEHFQKRVGEVLVGLAGVVHLADDILVYGQTKAEHDARLAAVLSRLREKRVTLNKDKCVFATQRTKFLGYVIDAQTGVQPDPDKVAAIVGMPAPTCAADVNRFLGMVNYQLKFMPHLSTLTQPLRDLRREDVDFMWTPVHSKAFEEIKKSLIAAPALAFFDPKKSTRVSADSSSYGLGAVLEQLHTSWEYDGVVHRDIWRPVYYASRTLTDTEKRYAQIEKEALALTWACEKFAMFITGDPDLLLRTDHKPLVSLLGDKPLSELTPRLQRMRMRLMRFSFKIEHVSGKALHSPDTLSRAPQQPTGPVDDADVLTDGEVELHARAVVADLPVADPVLRMVQEGQQRDAVTQAVLRCVHEGWPHPRAVTVDLAPYHRERANLAAVDGILVRGDRLVIPESLRADMLGRLHAGHLGETKCLGRARASVWWPGVSEDVRRTCADCEICAQHRPQPVEPLMPSPVPERPWQRVAADLCQRGADHYLVVVDYYSRYPEVAKLGSLTSQGTIRKLKDIFARHGVPEEVRTDNGPQFDCAEFRAFAAEQGFRLTTMSPGFSQSNGAAEAAVKAIIKKDSDPYRGLLAYRTAPLESGYSPAELLMGRQLRSQVPVIPSKLQPREVDRQRHRAALQRRRERGKADFDRRHRAKELRPLVSGESVWVRDKGVPGIVLRRREEPRSYDVRCQGVGVLRRNRAFLRPLCRQRDVDEWDSDDEGQGSAAVVPTAEGRAPSPVPPEARPPEAPLRPGSPEAPPRPAPPEAPLRRSERDRRRPQRLIEEC
ncbi:hypothetical protein ONE63_009576 [Megalurothrips usitatus]|uniref:RNA-directed DNA polymerase n=1 Tax=Megalurothrips usitatus TaxID=439358 RepID=A0AAV7XNE1_9NEOP|nr:hypothetical protein ONE63_009576 [Megalurothrips usitatus]